MSAPSFWSRYRGLIVVVALGLVFVVATVSGAFDDVDPEGIRAMVLEAGPWGMLLFLVLFTVGELVHIPGMLFVIAGVLTYGRGVGFALGFAGAVISVSVGFLVVRLFGGQALAELKWKFVQRILAKMDERPVPTVFVLRSIFWLAPALTFALAMTKVRFRHFFVGSCLGLIAPVAFVTLALEQAMTLFSS